MTWRAWRSNTSHPKIAPRASSCRRRRERRLPIVLSARRFAAAVSLPARVENHSAQRAARPDRGEPQRADRGHARSGADHDDAQHAGLASLVSDLLDEGAGNRDAIKLAEDIGLLGAALGTGADWDASYISIDVLSRNAEPSVAILSDVSSRATLPADGFERVRSERLNEILQQRDEPGAIAGKRFAALLYGEGVYGNSVIGNPESVARITLDDVRRFYQQHFVPNNSSVVVTGDISAKDATAIVERKFGSWKKGGEPPRPDVTPKPIDSSRIYIIDRPQAVQSEIRVGHIGVPRSTEDYFPLSVMNALLGGVFNSRINLNLRERHGYTYGARSTFAFRRQAGPFVVAAPVRNEVTRESVTEVLSELRRIRTGDIEGTELDDVKNYLMGVFPATVQTSSDIAGRLVDMELYALPEDYFDRYRENIAAIDRDEIARVAHKYIDPDRALIVIVGSAKAIREPLGQLGFPIHELDIEGKEVGPVA
jgi:zinc protease